MTANADNSVLFLDTLNLGPDLTWVLKRMKSAHERGEVGENVLRVEDFRRWARVLNLLFADTPGQSLLDVGIGAGQFVNAAAHSGHFSKVTGLDREKHSSFKALTARFGYVQKSLIMPQQPKMRHDIVTCMECLEHIKTMALQTAIDNLRYLARKRLIITVPFREPLPLSTYHFQHFDEERLAALFPDARISYLACGRRLQWALVDIHVPLVEQSREVSPPLAGAVIGVEPDDEDESAAPAASDQTVTRQTLRT